MRLEVDMQARRFSLVGRWWSFEVPASGSCIRITEAHRTGVRRGNVAGYSGDGMSVEFLLIAASPSKLCDFDRCYRMVSVQLPRIEVGLRERRTPAPA